MKHSTTTWVALAACAVLATAACGSSGSDSLANGENGGAAGSGSNDPNDPTGTNGTANGTGPNGTVDPSQQSGPDGRNPDGTPIALKADYGEALRSASLKLVGELPTLAEIKAIAAATDDASKKTVYEATVDKYLADPRFADAQVAWWRNTLKTGQDGTAAAGAPNMDTAANFAASVVVGDRPWTDILTATTGTCPTHAAGTATFTAANCTTNAKVSGVLTDPGLMAQYTSNMAFRRVRFVQETFACQKFPAEVVSPGTPMGSGTYTSPWDFNSIAGGTGSKIDFHDTSAVICANCHTTMNHLAPLFANFDTKGAFQATIQVQTPVNPAVTTAMTDWLPAGQGLAWRNGVAVTDLPTLGAAMSKDPAVLQCAVTRVWDWALSRGDVVNDGATVTPTVIASQVQAFNTGGLKLKSVIRAVFTADDFVKY